jgi:hypothetical protein
MEYAGSIDPVHYRTTPEEAPPMNMNKWDAWEAYARDEQCRVLDQCPDCDGHGDHGVDEDGRLYACYACCTTGKYFPATAAQPLRAAA